MEVSSCRLDQGESSSVPHGNFVDWRTQLGPQARQRIVGKIMEVLKRHLPMHLPEVRNDLSKIAIRFEEKMYAAAANQSDYLRKISLKLLLMENKSRGGGPGQSIPFISNNPYINRNPVDPDSEEHEIEDSSSDDTSHGNDSLQSESQNSGLTGNMITRKRDSDSSEFASGFSGRKKSKKVDHLSSSVMLLAEAISFRAAAKPELQDSKKCAKESAQKEADTYSIASCMDILNNIPDVSINAYVAACNQFRDPAWRNIFVKMPVYRRLQWLESMVNH